MGSVVAQNIAEMTLGAWGGDSAFFGKKGHNPATNDGTIAGLLVAEYRADIYAPHGGEASIGTDIGRLTVWTNGTTLNGSYS